MTGKVAPYKKKFGPMPAEVFHVPFPNEMHGVSVKQSLDALGFLFRADVEPDRAFVVYGGDERFPKAPGVEAIGLDELAAELVQLHAPTGSGVDDPPARAQRTGAARTQMRNESPRKSS